MAHLTLEQKLRTAHVKRWQIVRVGREQTLAEHMYLVYHITEAVMVSIGLGVLEYGSLEWALIHDIPEVVTGDINTPIKRAMREAVPQDDPIRKIELQLDDRYAELYNFLKAKKPYILLAVKIADILEAMRFLAFEGQGSQAEQALIDLYDSYLDHIAEGLSKFQDKWWARITNDIFREIVIPELSDEMILKICIAGHGRPGSYEV